MDDDAARAIGARLAEIYEGIWVGPMQDVPICNDALGVAAVGFRAHGDAAIGIVVTPWFMNLIVVEEKAKGGMGQTVPAAVPAGDVDCVTGWLEGFGALRACSLFSPMFQFAQMAIAVDVAEAAMTAFFTPPPREERSAPAQSLDRRALLKGRLVRDAEPLS
ncbi:[NiFe]-hydrogenase assembly chaperone HybE [Methylocystis echinoides]|uniref:Hydrogenase expression/formation protein HupJ n=1 Tax=Methylocystis echinoides TaxID=29468 RepID=A0A9W6LRS5_9HYPH|nr:[NiFe]-hydrogenase assembly chaperone HybE [Methylocystis echinoides]GLI92604.1 hydrogenase expression/formation protein HupJ [Methylocystis echinoides]